MLSTGVIINLDWGHKETRQEHGESRVVGHKKQLRQNINDEPTIKGVLPGTWQNLCRCSSSFMFCCGGFCSHNNNKHINCLSMFRARNVHNIRSQDTLEREREREGEEGECVWQMRRWLLCCCVYYSESNWEREREREREREWQKSFDIPDKKGNPMIHREDFWFAAPPLNKNRSRTAANFSFL